MRPEQIDINRGLPQTFRLRIAWQAFVAIPCLILASVPTLLVLGWLPLVLLGLISGGNLGLALYDIVSFLPVFLFWIAFVLPLVLLAVSIWRAGVVVSGKGITYRSSGVFRGRFMPWDDVLGVTIRRGEDARIILKNGGYVSFSAFEERERLAQVIESVLRRLGRFETRPFDVQISRGPFQYPGPFQRRSRTFAAIAFTVASMMLFAAAIVSVRAVLTGIVGSVLQPSGILLLLTAFLIGFAAYSILERSGRRIEITDEGINFSYLTKTPRWMRSVFHERFIPWANVIGVRRDGERTARILLARGRAIPIGGIAGAEKMLQSVEAMLERVEGLGRTRERRAYRWAHTAATAFGILLFYGSLIAVIVFTLKRG